MGDLQAEAAETEAGIVVAPQSRHIALVFVHGGRDDAEREFLYVLNCHVNWREREILVFRFYLYFHNAFDDRMFRNKQAVVERKALR